MRLAGFTALLLWTITLATTSHAAPVTLTFHAEIVAGPLLGTAGTGFFTWESEAVNPEGIQTLFCARGSGDLLEVQLNIFGQTFTANNDVSDYPALQFFDGSPTLLDYVVQGGTPGLPQGILFLETYSFALAPPEIRGYDFFVKITAEGSGYAVPEPGTWILLGISLPGVAIRRRQFAHWRKART